jgi:hypothetical protein
MSAMEFAKIAARLSLMSLMKRLLAFEHGGKNAAQSVRGQDHQ